MYICITLKSHEPFSCTSCKFLFAKAGICNMVLCGIFYWPLLVKYQFSVEKRHSFDSFLT